MEGKRLVSCPCTLWIFWPLVIRTLVGGSTGNDRARAAEGLPQACLVRHLDGGSPQALSAPRDPLREERKNTSVGTTTKIIAVVDESLGLATGTVGVCTTIKKNPPSKLEQVGKTVDGKQ